MSPSDCPARLMVTVICTFAFGDNIPLVGDNATGKDAPFAAIPQLSVC